MTIRSGVLMAHVYPPLARIGTAGRLVMADGVQTRVRREASLYAQDDIARAGGRPTPMFVRARARLLALLSVAVLAYPLAGCGTAPESPPFGPSAAVTASPTSSAPPSSASPSSTSPTPAPRTSSAGPVVRVVPAAPPKNPEVLPKPKPAPLPADPRRLPGAPPGSRGVVYLTFDDGPSTFTPEILRILTRTHSTATFFQLGVNQRLYPDLVGAVRAQGSSIGNHTYDHRDLTMMSNAGVRSELKRGPKGSKCARPPYGATTPRVRQLINGMGMTQMLWSNDTSDWSRPGSRVIYLRAAGPQIGNGSVVLMHDGGGPRAQTVAALPKIIAELQRRGYLIRKLPGC